jgi:hypothetical protein
MIGSEDEFIWLYEEGDLDKVFHIAELIWRLEVNILDAHYQNMSMLGFSTHSHWVMLLQTFGCSNDLCDIMGCGSLCPGDEENQGVTGISIGVL